MADITSRPFIFISCGQQTNAEKELGRSIVQLIESRTGADAFFAEDVQDLSGLDSNILRKLSGCAALIVVMHPRGEVTDPDGSRHIRGSVWIEQEIAVATYIRRMQDRDLPVIAFVHQTVAREGIRQLLQLNPIPFSEGSEVLTALQGRLSKLSNLPAKQTMLLRIQAGQRSQEEGHWIRQLEVVLSNETDDRVIRFDGMLRVPTPLLKHWNTVYHGEDPKLRDEHYRCFRFNEIDRGPIAPHDEATLYRLKYCTQCASNVDTMILIGGAIVDAYVCIAGHKYEDSRSIQQLCAGTDA